MRLNIIEISRRFTGLDPPDSRLILSPLLHLLESGVSLEASAFTILILLLIWIIHHLLTVGIHEVVIIVITVGYVAFSCSFELSVDLESTEELCDAKGEHAKEDSLCQSIIED